MRRVAIVGAGMIPFGELFSSGIKEMLPRTLGKVAASVDKGFSTNDIEAAWFGMLQPSDGYPAGILADSCNLLNIPVTRVENQCATGSDAVRNAAMAVSGGHFNVALVMGADKTRETPSKNTFWDWMALARDMAWDFPLGLISPGNFALHVSRYMHEYGVSRTHLAMVAVKNHSNAVKNPNAQLRFPVTIEQVLSAPMVAEPFGLLDCSPQTDGAAGVLIVAEELVSKYTDRPVWIRGFGLGMDYVMHAHKKSFTSFAATTKAAKVAYSMAGISPKDIDVAEIHDCFTGVELMNYEDLGFCEVGEAKNMIENGLTLVNGILPVNTSGGLKAKGHPPGATGVAQCVEIFEQLRGDACNQIEKARFGLTHNIGGPTAVSAVIILEKHNG